VKGWKSAPDPGDVRAAADLLLAARDPLIYAGEGLIYAGASGELTALAELVNVPVITTLKAKGAFPEDHKLFVGVRGDQVGHYLNKSDLILAVGSRDVEGDWRPGVPYRTGERAGRGDPSAAAGARRQRVVSTGLHRVHIAASTRSTADGLDAARSKTIPKLIPVADV
jgi:hypothetical protein